MFQNLANYLLGTNTSSSGNSNEDDREANGVETHINTRLTSVVSEDDWVLVDRDSEGNSEVSSVESLDLDIQQVDLEADDHDLSPCVLTRSSSTLSLPCGSSALEESWFLTPPPCFTSTGPIHMATSPLENLLIEHPSMSVYQHTPLHRRYVTAVTPVRTSSPSYVAIDHTHSVDDDIDSDEVVDLHVEEVEDEEIEERVVVLVQRAPSSRPVSQHRNNNTIKELQQRHKRQCLKNKQAQKVRIQQACETLKRNYLERNNKARDVNSRNRRLRRSERSQGATRSHANNNRKC